MVSLDARFSGRRAQARALFDEAFPAEDRDSWIVVLTVIATLIANNELGTIGKLENYVGTIEASDLGARLYWAGFRIGIYLIPAWLVGRWVLRRPMRDLGWRIQFSWPDARPYAWLFVAMFPLVLAASTLDSFQAKYPFFRPGDGQIWPEFVVYELAYFGQFIALELFYRGFIIEGLRPRFGRMAVALMVVPYVMIHFSKPLPEALGAIVAGIVLGMMAYRSRVPIWGGVLHFAVALTMDLLVL